MMQPQYGISDFGYFFCVVSFAVHAALAAMYVNVCAEVEQPAVGTAVRNVTQQHDNTTTHTPTAVQRNIVGRAAREKNIYF